MRRYRKYPITYTCGFREIVFVNITALNPMCHTKTRTFPFGMYTCPHCGTTDTEKSNVKDPDLDWVIDVPDDAVFLMCEEPA